jgi:hypothetical protein
MVALVVGAQALAGTVFASRTHASTQAPPPATSTVHRESETAVAPMPIPGSRLPTGGVPPSAGTTLLLLLVTAMLTSGGFVAVRPRGSTNTVAQVSPSSGRHGRVQSQAVRNYRMSCVLMGLAMVASLLSVLFVSLALLIAKLS